MGSSLVAVGNLAADHGQFRWRSWSIAVATLGRLLAFLHYCANLAKRLMPPP